MAAVHNTFSTVTWGCRRLPGQRRQRAEGGVVAEPRTAVGPVQPELRPAVAHERTGVVERLERHRVGSRAHPYTERRVTAEQLGAFVFAQPHPPGRVAQVPAVLSAERGAG